MPTLCPVQCLLVCVIQANVLIRGVVVLDVRWVANILICYFCLCMLHVKSTVSCFILEVTNYEPLVYYMLLVC